MPTPQTGGCLCAKVRYETGGEPVHAIQCYCRDCQHMSGGGNAPQLAVMRDTVSISGPVRTFGLKSDSGNDVELGFCEECGSPIYKTTSKIPELIFLFAGSLDDPATFVPRHKVYEDRRLPWDRS